MRYESEKSDIFSMEISEHAKSIFLNMARWAKFLAIIGFIFSGVMLIAFPFILSRQAALPGVEGSDYSDSYQMGKTIGGVIAAVIISAVYFYPAYALLMYAIKVKKALLNTNQGQFEVSINYLKNMFKFMGILMIVVLILYGIVIIGAIIVAASKGF